MSLEPLSLSFSQQPAASQPASQPASQHRWIDESVKKIAASWNRVKLSLGSTSCPLPFLCTHVPKCMKIIYNIKISENPQTSPERRACGTTLEPLLIIINLSTSSQPASQPASPADRSDKSMNQRIDDSQLESTNKVFYRGHMSPLTVFRRPPSQSVSQPASLVMFTIKTSTKEQIATRTLVATHPHYEYHGYWQPHQWYVSTAPRRSCPRLL